MRTVETVAVLIVTVACLAGMASLIDHLIRARL